MLYISAGHNNKDTRDGAVKELLETDLVTVHAAINLVNSDGESTMMSWDQVHLARQ